MSSSSTTTTSSSSSAAAALPTALDFPATEEKICQQWKEQKTFQQQDALAADRGDKAYTFYDGPPFATGLPHYGHILAGTIKDIVTRWAVMSGYAVSRRAGWDCHGLPVEYEIDQALNITHRDQVLEMGIAAYNERCRSIVTRYTAQWRDSITRLGRWIDFDRDYKTMDASFMETVWWVFSRLHEKNLVYQGYKVMPYSTACSTPLSNFEAGLNYKEVKDPAVVVSFPVLNDDGTESEDSFVAWTTTPWTLPSNLALCVHPELEYVTIADKASNRRYVLAKSRLPQLYPVMNNKKKWKPARAAELYEILYECKGKELAGKRYAPLFDFYDDGGDASKKYWVVVADTYVTDDAGTGVVHQAPAFGEDDYRVCLAHGIIHKGQDIPCPVDASGMFTAPVSAAAGLGLHVKAADAKILALLKDAGRLVQKDVLLHSYPFCWRSDTPLIYKAVPSWFVRVEEFRDRIVANNAATYWVPADVKEGRFHNWLSDARDWSVSRNRFWGTPIPIWMNADDPADLVCVGSIQQLAELSGTAPVSDLHRETVDEITIPSQKHPGQVLRRVEEVFDCWFESGSMPYAQSHYPFENGETWEAGFPADFIAEGLDQTRGWFYTLMVLSTALFDRPAFQNCIVNGMVLAADGQKMSKRKKNYPDPAVVIDKYGADALRMYLVNSPVVRAEPLKFREDGVLGVVKEVFLPLYNAFRFFAQNCERWQAQQEQQFCPDVDKVKSSANPTDVWIQAETQALIQFVTGEMKAYRLYTVMPALVKFGTQLTNWYVRLNRDRLKGMAATADDGDDQNDKMQVDVDDTETGLQVLYDVLLDVSILMAPFTPFITEFFYQHLRCWQPSYGSRVNGGGVTNPVQAGKSDSVHFLRLPVYDASRLNPAAVAAMEALQSIVEQARNAREKRNLSLRTPVKRVVAVLRNPDAETVRQLAGPLRAYILQELHAWEFTVVPEGQEHDWVTLSLQPNFKALGKKLGKKMKAVQKAVQAVRHDDAVRCLQEGTLEVEGEVLDAATELESKLDFSREGDHWEATVKQDGSLVVAIDCTQDEQTAAAGTCRELINSVQQLRKAAGLDLSDVVEVFFEEKDGGTAAVEAAVAANARQFEQKFRGAVPLPSRHKPPHAVTLRSDTVRVGNDNLPVNVMICRPAVSLSDELMTEDDDDDDGKTSSPKAAAARRVLATMEPAALAENGDTFAFSVDGRQYTLRHGTDFWLSAAAKVRSTAATTTANATAATATVAEA